MISKNNNYFINKNLRINIKKKTLFFKKRFNSYFFVIFILFILIVIFLSNNTYNKAKLKNNIFRIHVVANSNKIEDQIIKHKINENIIEYINFLNNSNTNISSQKYLLTLKENIKNIQNIINITLKENNINYDAKIKIGNILYENKENIDLYMEKGNYYSMQILLGKAKGKNVWNLIFPNKKNIKKLKHFNNILPGIENIFDNLE